MTTSYQLLSSLHTDSFLSGTFKFFFIVRGGLTMSARWLGRRPGKWLDAGSSLSPSGTLLQCLVVANNNFLALCHFPTFWPLGFILSETSHMWSSDQKSSKLAKKWMMLSRRTKWYVSFLNRRRLSWKRVDPFLRIDVFLTHWRKSPLAISSNILSKQNTALL